MDIAAPLHRAQESKPIGKARKASLKAPFLDESWMDGQPCCSAASFLVPRLRQCTFKLATIKWKTVKKIDGGLDGYLWRVYFGKDGPYVLKVFWDDVPPDFEHYYAVQRESQNAALLQMIEAAVQRAADRSTPIVVSANPETKDEALANLLAFSDEGSQMSAPAEGDEAEAISSTPRMTKCHGWLKLSGQVFLQMPPRMRAPTVQVDKITRNMSPDKEYIAIVYEYVDDVANHPRVVEEVDRFLWLVGFSHADSPAAKNWRSSVLVDHSDIVHPRGFGWSRKLYGPMKASRILVSQPGASTRASAVRL
ncbi:Uncharacterized protein TPAR_07593 [Tolypocladium paradoxum]|uniref:Uncharacterized protein n=1 Tax=Tolypocladium paradoxum TaxID=94208 RepID=A0A2S4KPX1_9HYPO|nr:Uncharacterized protein TPAR_07593 [Tolypocladium paradoxum]